MKKILAPLVICLLWAASSEAAFTWRTSKQGTFVSASFTVTEPTSAASGDWEFVVAVMGGTAGANCTVATPVGWTQDNVAAGANMRAYVWHVTGGRGAGAPTLAFTVTGSGCGGEWHALGVAGSNVTVDASTFSAIQTSTTNPDPGAASATFTNDEAIAIGCNWNGTASAWAEASYTLRSVSGAFDCGVFSRDLVASGSENPAAFTNGAGPATDSVGHTVLLENSSPTSGGTCTPTLTLLGVGRCG